MKMNHHPLAKNIPYITKYLLFIAIALFAYVFVAQAILIPQEITRQYDQHLKPDLKLLSAKFNAVSVSSGLPAYSDPYADAQTSRNDLLATQKLIAETETSLNDYESQADKLPTSLFANYSQSYKKAEVVRMRAKDVFLQSREVLNGYKELTAYLLQVNTARTVMKNNVTDINGQTDLTRLAGQGDVIAKRVVQLRQTLDGLKSSHVPTGFAPYHAALIATMEQSLSSLNMISRGLYLTDDAQVNSGARALEQAIRKVESNDSALFTAAITHSTELSETGELADKVDSLQPFLAQ